MLKKACIVCKVVGVLAIIGALNWGMIGLFHMNLLDRLFGQSIITNVLYVFIGLSGVALLASFFMVCPACKKS